MIEQQTDSWHEWRSKGLGASDAPVVMNVSPWSTPFKLWQEKTGKIEKDAGNWATRKGNEMEPRARAFLELQTGLDFPAVLSEHSVFSWMRASLDGWNAENKIILEIKCPGAADHGIASEGRVPDKYYPQIQHQLFVTGGEKVLYFSYSETPVPHGYQVEVLPDMEYIKKLFAAMSKFWKCIQTNTAPDLVAKDFKSVRSKELQEKFEAWERAKNDLIVLEKRTEALKAALIEDPRVKDLRMRCGKYRVNVVTRKGNVDYKKVPQLAGVDLEPFRGKDSVYQQITVGADE